MKVNIIGIDLAKNVFHVCVMRADGKVLARKRLSRENLVQYLVKHWEGIVAMEACGGSHYWAREFTKHGYLVRIVAAQYVKPYVKSQKNDTVDAEAICEAALRPQMRFVSARTAEQQDMQNLHRVRDRLVRQRTALGNEIRGLLLEYGIVVPKGFKKLQSILPRVLEESGVEQSALWNETFNKLYVELVQRCEQVAGYEKTLKQLCKSSELCQRLCKIGGVGYLTATAVVAAVGNIRDFKNGRQFAAWLGLVPKQHSTGGKTTLRGISKQGNRYLRKLFILGARSEMRVIKKRNSATSFWAQRLLERRSHNCSVVALANKNARCVWALMATGEQFQQPEQQLALAA